MPTCEPLQDHPTPQHITSLENMIPDPVPSTSKDGLDKPYICQSPSSKKTDQRPTGEIKTPEELQPFKKTSPRKTQRCIRRKRHTAMLTDTPEKMKLLEQNEDSHGKRLKNKTCKRKLNNKGFLKSGGEKNRKNMEDYWCLACGGEWSNSASGEQWVQCIKCKDWAHESCTNESVYYVCDLCEMK